MLDLVDELVHNQLMKVNVHEAKTHLSRYLRELKPGEALLICNRNEPVAELRMLEKKSSQPRPIGKAQAYFTVPDSFFEDLPAEELAAFEGESETAA